MSRNESGMDKFTKFRFREFPEDAAEYVVHVQDH